MSEMSTVQMISVMTLKYMKIQYLQAFDVKAACVIIQSNDSESVLEERPNI